MVNYSVAGAYARPPFDDDTHVAALVFIVILCVLCKVFFG